MPNVKFYLKPESPKDKTRLIVLLVKFTIKDRTKISKQYPKGEPIPVRLTYTWDCKIGNSKWNKQQQINAGTSDYPKNAEMKGFATAFNNAWEESPYMPKEYYREKLEEYRYRKVTPVETASAMTLFKFMQKRVDSARIENRQKENLQTELNYLKENFPNLNFASFDSEFAKNYEQKRKGIAAPGSFNAYISRLRTLSDLLIDAGHIASNPFAKIKTTKGKAKDRASLSETELEKIRNVDLSTQKEKWAVVRLLFLTGAWSGMRYSDFRNITARGSVKQVSDGWIFDFISFKTRNSTGERCTVAVDPRIIELNPDFPIFPEWTDPKTKGFNAYLKKIAKLADVDSGGLSISAHVGRISFVGNSIDDGIDLPNIQKLVGHAGAAMTLHYDRRDARAAIDQQRKSFKRK